MKTISLNSKQGQSFMWRYNHSKATDLKQEYKKPSSKKIQAFNYCKELCESEGGTDFKVISAGCHFFSVAWKVEAGLRVKTYANSYLVINK